MKKFVLSLSVFAVAISFAYAQTKMIAHRSHSGSDESLTFNTSDNFGIPSSVPAFVQDTTTKEKMWVDLEYGLASDSVRLLQRGYRSLPYDSAYPRPPYDKLREIRKRSRVDRSTISVDTNLLH